MDRVKDISKVRLAPGYVLIKIKLKQSLIIAPDKKEKSGPMVDYADVISVGKEVTDILPGDVVLDFRTTEGFEWQGDQYAIVPRMNIKFSVERDNFNFDGIFEKKTKRLTN
jgi:hypothetical protein